jgi:hypothetical protein
MRLLRAAYIGLLLLYTHICDEFETTIGHTWNTLQFLVVLTQVFAETADVGSKIII